MRKLTCANPQAPKKLVVYNNVQTKFETVESVPAHVMHFSMDGMTILKDSLAGRNQLTIENERARKLKQVKEFHSMSEKSGTGEINEKEARNIMRNTFNYSTRESQTAKPLILQRSVSTVNPVMEDLSRTVNQSWIYDVYAAHFERVKREQVEKDKLKDRRPLHPLDDDEDSPEASAGQDGYIYTDGFKRKLKIMERMVVQNNAKQMFDDYKYMFTDEAREEAKLNDKRYMDKLWKFDYPATKNRAVTSLAWNPKYRDMFAVGYGTYDFGNKKSSGYICLCTLKNNKSPDKIFQTSDHVMCLDWHPEAPALLAVGLYDGVVLVYDVREKSKEPIYRSSIKTNKHSDPVWQVKWNSDISKHLNFYSISSDGRVMNWIMMKDKLEPEEIFRLKLINKSIMQYNCRK